MEVMGTFRGFGACNSNSLTGDDEAVCIWEISTRKCVDVLDDPGKQWGQITCLTWLANLGNDELKPIAFRTGCSLVVIYWHSHINIIVFFGGCCGLYC